MAWELVILFFWRGHLLIKKNELGKLEVTLVFAHVCLEKIPLKVSGA